MLKRPSVEEYPDYYFNYIDQIPDLDILMYYEKQTEELVDLYRSFSEEKLLFRYSQEKWSLKELILHLIESEIVMGYRALVYSRKDKTNLPFYDHDEYVKQNHANKLVSEYLIRHFFLTRQSNLLLFNSFNDQDWIQKGLTGGKIFTTRSIPYILAGHTEHHLNVIRNKYI